MAKYKVGDKVRVKSWDKLAEELGVDKDGDINTAPCFVMGMKKYCGQVVTIKENAGIKEYYKLDNVPYLWSDKMFEDVSDNTDDTSDNTEVPSDNANHPSHYDDDNIEVIKYIEARTRENIKKAIYYLQKCLEVE